MLKSSCNRNVTTLLTSLYYNGYTKYSAVTNHVDRIQLNADEENSASVQNRRKINGMNFEIQSIR